MLHSYTHIHNHTFHKMFIIQSIFTVQNGCSPLYVASQGGHTDIVDILLRSGADVHQATIEVYYNIAQATVCMFPNPQTLHIMWCLSL